MSQTSPIPVAEQGHAGVDWPRFSELIGASHRILLTSHIRPDCDALGSELAMAGILQSLGKEVRIVNAFEVPRNLRFLDPDGKAERLGEDVPNAWIESIDLLLVLDTTAWAQLGDMGDVIRSTPATVAVLDHHVSGDDLGAELFKDNQAEATGRLVVEAADCLGVELTPAIAKAALAALATDTGWFRFASTSADTLRLAARLVDAGVRVDDLYRELYEDDTVGRLKLIGRAMARIEPERDGRLIHTYLTRQDFDECGAAASDSEDVINLTLTVGGTQFAVILIEQVSGKFKISFRSRCDVDCSRVAEQFGGGGHRKAAGATVDGPLEAARARVLDGVRAAVQ